MSERIEPVDASPDKGTGDSGVAGSRRDAGVPSGTSVPDVSAPERPAAGDPTTSNLSEMVSTDDGGDT